MLGKTEGRRSRGQQRIKWVNCITDSRDMDLETVHISRRYGDGPGTGRPVCAAVHGVGLGDGQGQGDLVCCSPRGCKESDKT